MKKIYKIEFVTMHPTETGEALISRALGFNKTLSRECIVDLFSERSIKGCFTSKKRAESFVNKIKSRNSFGGFGQHAVFAKIV